MRMLFVFLLFTGLQFSAYARVKIIIDAGHGGTDKGAIFEEAIEGQIVLSVAQKLRDELNKSEKFTVQMSREADRQLSLEDRRRLVERHEGQLFLSLHANSSPDRRASGLEVYFQNPLAFDEVSALMAHEHSELTKTNAARSPSSFSEDSDIQNIIYDLKKSHNIWRSQELARTIIMNWSFEGANKKRRVAKQAPFYLVSQLHTPAILVEIGFLTNERESKLLRDEAYQQKMASALAKSLQLYSESYSQ